MRVLVAGATGAVGKPLVKQLVSAGHDVAGTSRSAERSESLRGLRAQPVVCDALDPEAVERAVASLAPEVIVNELTAIPAALNPRKMAEQFKLTNRLRIEGTENLMAAAERHGVRRLISQSIAFAYAPSSSPPLVEEHPLVDNGDLTAALKALESRTLGSETVEGVVLRYGFFYGPGSSYAKTGNTAEQVRARRFPVIGDGEGRWPFIHVDDAAAATVAAVERGRPGVYNIVDDEPAPVREWLPGLAEAIGAKPPRHIPKLVARVLAGSQVVEYSTALQPVSNAKAKAELGWEPGFASWREGFIRGL